MAIDTILLSVRMSDESLEFVPLMAKRSVTFGRQCICVHILIQVLETDIWYLLVLDARRSLLGDIT